ncbi:hypothetical protein SDC9_143623 [bioreactor metagenome]|uniref:Uncharacterized protein n=1 Tax=bioreactor metagenome TaxID=1076179 RepID=A0A645E3X4_9ZZZZ
MIDSGDAWISPHNLQTVPVSLPVVHHHGEAQAQSQRHLSPEHVLLKVPGGVVVMIIQADFPNGLDLGVEGHGLQGRQPAGGNVFRVVGMNADGGVDEGVAVGQLNTLAGGSHVAPGTEHQRNALVGQSADNGVPVGVEGPVVIMGVGVKQSGYHSVPPAVLSNGAEK